MADAIKKQKPIDDIILIYEQLFTDVLYVLTENPPLVVKESKQEVVLVIDEEEHNFDISTSVFKNIDGILGLLVSYENTKKIKELEQKLSSLEGVMAAGELAAAAVHEIKNPLFSMRGFLQLLERSLEEGDIRRKYTKTVISEIDRLHRLVDEFLSLFRKSDRQKTIVNIKRTLQNTIELFKPHFEMQNINYCFKNEAQKSMVYGNKNQLKQVFINVLQNCLESMEEGKGLYISIKNSTNKVIIIFKDEGKGIKSKELDKIFDPFFTTKDKGTGLGLYISKKLIIEHKGNIKVKSKEGIGTSFIIELPLA